MALVRGMTPSLVLVLSKRLGCKRRLQEERDCGMVMDKRGDNTRFLL